MDDQNISSIISHSPRLYKAAIECQKQMKEPSPEGWCPAEWYYVVCWSPSPPGVMAETSCFSEFKGVKYDDSANATRWCDENGRWANYSNLENCQSIIDEKDGVNVEELQKIQDTATAYMVGYVLSLIALLIAVGIFLYFKDLRCLRNTIHTNLMSTYIIVAIFWILLYNLQLLVVKNWFFCFSFFILIHYFQMTNFCWMFVEGLYLYMLVVETFTRENIKLRVYLIIGWGVPFIVLLVWVVTRTLSHDEVDPTSKNVELMESIGCSWMGTHSADWIYQGFAVFILIVNFIFLIRIMWVLITKLRSANNVETQQYRKATKALLVLIPLLGITYILFIIGPSHGIYGDIYNNLRAVLISTQGLSVAIFYCFLNTEVRNTVHHHFGRWKEARDLGRRYTLTKDWSPNTRTESIRS